MSFSSNPFKGLRITVTDDTEALTDVGTRGTSWEWACDSCGAQSSRGNSRRTARVWSELEDIGSIVRDWRQHVINSHGLTPEDVADWSKH